MVTEGMANIGSHVVDRWGRERSAGAETDC
jgi:hypothetical protein